MRKSYQLTWNAAIDEYINSGVDPRPKAEIERQAKVGTWGGAFIRQCESEECENLETDPRVAKMMQCSGCKIVRCFFLSFFSSLFLCPIKCHLDRVLLSPVPKGSLAHTSTRVWQKGAITGALAVAACDQEVFSGENSLHTGYCDSVGVVA